MSAASMKYRDRAETEYKPDWDTNLADTDKLVAAAPRAELLAGTAWLFAHEDWVRFGGGIEYYLPRGFPAAALAFPWELEVR